MSAVQGLSGQGPSFSLGKVLYNEISTHDDFYFQLAVLTAELTLLYWYSADESKLTERERAQKERTNSIDFRMGCPWLYIRESLTTWKIVSKKDLEENLFGIGSLTLAISLVGSLAQRILKSAPKEPAYLDYLSCVRFVGIALISAKVISSMIYIGK